MKPYQQSAAALITNHKGEILLLQQTDGFFGLPGGRVALDELPPQTAIRETLAAISIQIELDYLIGSYLLENNSDPIFASVYKARIIQGIPEIADADSELEIIWYPSHKLPEHLLSDAKVAISDFIVGKRGVVVA